jgi:hypothetical protein
VKPGAFIAVTVWALIYFGPSSCADEIKERDVANVLHGKDSAITQGAIDPGNIPFLSLSIRFDPDSGALLPESYVKLVPIGQMLKSPTMSAKRLLFVCCTDLEPATDIAFVMKLLDNIQRFLTAQVAVPADSVRTMTMAQRPSSLPETRILPGGKTVRVEIFTLE